MREARALLDQMVADQLKALALGKNDRFVVERAVFEMEDDVCRDAVAAGELDQVSIRQRGAVQAFDQEKAPGDSLRMADRHRLGDEHGGWKEACKHKHKKKLKKTAHQEDNLPGSHQQSAYRRNRLSQNCCRGRTYANQGRFAIKLEVSMSNRVRSGFLAFVLVLGLSVTAFGAQGLTFPPSGDNQRSTITQAIGPVKVTIDYSSPRVVRGQNDRKGKIWGELVPWGMSDLGFNGCASCPWRAADNENTTFTTTHEIKVQGQALPAGTYGLHMIPAQDEWTVIFSKDAEAWGSFWYDQKHDAMRVKTKAGKSDYHEFLTYEFTEREP